MSLNISFQNNDSLHSQDSPNYSLIKSLEDFGNNILWRKSVRGVSDHFILRRNNKGEVKEYDASLFRMINNQPETLEKDSGENFLIFFFLYPAATAFNNKKDEIRESIVVSLHPKRLLNLIHSASGLCDKFEKLELSRKQHYGEYATHYGLYYQQKSNGEYFDLDDDVLHALDFCSEINPKHQEENYDFINNVINKCEEINKSKS